MKQETRTREQYYDVYIAMDGEEFRDKEECEKYEQSAKAVVSTNYKRLVVGKSTEEAFFGFGCCDNDVEFVKVTSKEDADVVMQMNYIVNPHMAEKPDSYKSSIERIQNLMERAINEDDVLIVGRGYDNECFWFIGTRNSMKEEIDYVCKASVPEDKREE